MKKKYLLLLLLGIIFRSNLSANENTKAKVSDDCESMSFAVDSNARQHEKIKCLLLSLGQDKFLSKLSNLIKYDLEFSDQLEVDLKESKTELDEKIQTKLFDQGFSLLLYLRKNGNKINAVLKDMSSQAVYFEKDFNVNLKDVVFSSHKISDELIPVLTGGEKAICLSSLAYCKRLSPKQQVICVSDYACKKEKTVVGTKTVNVAPSFHTKAPGLLFYSQFTKFNNRLMSLDLNTKKNRVICSYEGLNMQPSFSQDGSKVALCLSGGKNSEVYLYDSFLCKKLGKKVFVPLTKNKGNNASPCLLPNEDLIFCSDFETRLPQIYYLDKKLRQVKRVTNGKGYCAAPSYCPKTNSVVYSRMQNGTFQLFALNLDERKEKQLTFGYGDKHEPAISECGRFIAFAFEQEYSKKHSTLQIAILNVNSGKIRVLTSGKEAKCFPKWSKDPVYI
jgi:tol-pal system beta propeller repeat protein TolB